MKFLICIMVMTVFLFNSSLYANETASNLDSSKFLQLLIKIISKAELDEIQNGMEKWHNPEAINKLSKKFIDDEYIEKLYIRFKFIAINPSVAKGSKKAVQNIENFGKSLHNLLHAMRKDEFKKYGKIISIMRDVLFLESIHIPMAIERDGSRKEYWYKIHDEWLKELEKEFAKYIGVKNETNKK